MKIEKVEWLKPDSVHLQGVLPYCIVLGFDFRGRMERCAHAFATPEMFAEYIAALTAIYEPHERPDHIYVQYVK